MTVEDVSIYVCEKPGERYLWIFPATREGRQDVRKSAGRMAGDLDLSLTWMDAAALGQRLDEDDAEDQRR